MSDSAAGVSVAERLTELAVGFLGERTQAQVALFRQRIRDLVAPYDEVALQRVLQRIDRTGQAWGYHPPEDLVRRIYHAMGEITLLGDSCLVGGEHLEEVRDRKLILLSNHLSYSDANLIEILLARGGFEDVGARLSVVTGPKVYTDPLRRFSSLCFGTIKTPQSVSRASGQAVMAPRDVAAIAKQSLAAAAARVDAGDHLLLFPEGTRSRNGQMQPLLPAIARYLQDPDTFVLPVGITGTEHLVRLGENRVRETEVIVRLGRALPVHEMVERAGGKRAPIATEAGRAIAMLLPPGYRGHYDEDGTPPAA